MKRKAFFMVAALIAFLAMMGLFHSTCHSAEESLPLDAELLRQGMRKIIDFLDSDEYADKVSWDEHVVLTYRLAAGRDPDIVEFYQLKKLRETVDLPRSSALSMALRSKSSHPEWSQCRNFLSRFRLSDFQADGGVRASVEQLAGEPLRKVFEELERVGSERLESTLDGKRLEPEAAIPYMQYNTYFGFLHAHSNLSDGEGSPQEAYSYARDYGGLDFFSLSDHSEQLDLWPWDNSWQELIDAAIANYQPGSFVTLWGFEWGSPIFGHVNVINTEDLASIITEITLEDLYEWISNRPECFGQFNHPGQNDFLNQEFLHLEAFPEVIDQMVGIENLNAGSDFDTFYYGGGWSSPDYSYWDEGNRKGWYLGSLASQDNHSKNWGTRNQFRTAVLAEELTREAIVDAYRKRRFYATEDKDLYLDFRCQGYPMGSRLAGEQRIFEVTAWDGSGDSFQEVRLYRNGDLLNAVAVSGNSIHVYFDDISYSDRLAYYYVIVQQADDNDGSGRNDEAISSPIWSEVADSFSDVPPDHWAYESIEKLYDAGITKGCDEDRYCPQDMVTRAEMAVFIERAIHGRNFTPPAAVGLFADVPETHWAADWIEQLYADGVTGGCSSNPIKYCPGAPVARSEMAVFLLKAKYGISYIPIPATGIFDDVPTHHWAADWIEQLYDESITTGCEISPPMFCPEDSVTRAEMAVFLVRTFDF